MRLFIPALKTTLTLSKEWMARIHWESRNISFVANVQGYYPHTGENFDKLRQLFNISEEDLRVKNSWRLVDEFVDINIPKGTKLVVDRIYIRQGVECNNSVTFRIPKTKGSRLYGRFWVKLDNANTMEIEDA